MILKAKYQEYEDYQASAVNKCVCCLKPVFFPGKPL